MQREAGPQVVSPLYLHQIQHQHQLPPHAKKRGNPWGPATEPPSSENTAAAASTAAAAAGNWNPRMWDWDSRAFTARPSSDAPPAAAVAEARVAPVTESRWRRSHIVRRSNTS